MITLHVLSTGPQQTSNNNLEYIIRPNRGAQLLCMLLLLC